jgi:hypothetical protein
MTGAGSGRRRTALAWTIGFGVLAVSIAWLVRDPRVDATPATVAAHPVTDRSTALTDNDRARRAPIMDAIDRLTAARAARDAFAILGIERAPPIAGELRASFGRRVLQLRARDLADPGADRSWLATYFPEACTVDARTATIR